MRRRVHDLADALVASRRQFILAGASLAVLPWLGTHARGEVVVKPSFHRDPFQLGVASGDPSPDGFVLWTRLAPRPLEAGGGLPDAATYEVFWEIAEDEKFMKRVGHGTALATPELGHSVHVEVVGLRPDRWYFYRFMVGAAQSMTGRARTMPAYDASPDRLRFAFTSCQHYETGLFTGFEHMAREELDLVLHLGDYIYEYAGIDKRVRKHVGKEIVSLDDYRVRHAQYKTDVHLQAAHALCPWLVVWDDHEFDNNCAGDISEEKNVDREDYLIRRAAAYQAYYENMPLRAACMPKGPDMQLYRRIHFGRLAQFEMLDTRQYRTDQPNNDGNKPLEGDVFHPKATLLGDEQETWLMEGLTRSKATWNILGQQVMMARVDRAPGPDQRFSMDQWAGYDVARKRLLSFMAERKIANPIVLTGDIHTNWVNDLKVDFDDENDPTIATEFVCTSISSGGNGNPSPAYLRALMSENPFVRFHNAERGYTSCTITPKEWRSDYQVVEFVDRPGAEPVTRGSFVVEAGEAGAKAV